MIGGTNVYNVVRDQRRTGNGTPCAKFPAQATCAIFKTIEIAIDRTAVEGIFINNGGAVDLVLRPEAPDLFGAAAFHGVNKSIRCAHKDQIIHDTGGANGGLAQTEPPEYPAIPGIQCIKCAVDRGKV